MIHKRFYNTPTLQSLIDDDKKTSLYRGGNHSNNLTEEYKRLKWLEDLGRQIVKNSINKSKRNQFTNYYN